MKRKNHLPSKRVLIMNIYHDKEETYAYYFIYIVVKVNGWLKNLNPIS